MLRRSYSSLSLFKSTPITLLRYGKRERDVETGEKSRMQIHNALYFNDEYSPCSIPFYNPFVFNINQDITRFINFSPTPIESEPEAIKNQKPVEKHVCMFPVQWIYERDQKFNSLADNLIGPDGNIIPDPVVLVGLAMNSCKEQFVVGGSMMDRSEALFQALEMFLKAKEPIPPSLWYAIGLTIPFMEGIVSGGDMKKKYPVDCFKNAWLFRQSGHSSAPFEEQNGALFLAHLGRALVLQEFLDCNLPIEARRRMLVSQGKSEEEINKTIIEVLMEDYPGTSLQQQADIVPTVELPTVEHKATSKILLKKYDALAIFEKCLKDLAPHPVDSAEGPRSFFSNLFVSKTVVKDEKSAGRLRASVMRGAATLLEMREARGMIRAGRVQNQPKNVEEYIKIMMDQEEGKQQKENKNNNNNNDLEMKHERDFDQQLSLTHSTEGREEYVGLLRKFRTLRDSELYGPADLRRLAELQILDPEQDEIDDIEAKRKGQPEKENIEDWQANQSANPFFKTAT